MNLKWFGYQLRVHLEIRYLEVSVYIPILLIDRRLLPDILSPRKPTVSALLIGNSLKDQAAVSRTLPVITGIRNTAVNMIPWCLVIHLEGCIFFRGCLPQLCWSASAQTSVDHNPDHLSLLGYSSICFCLGSEDNCWSIPLSTSWSIFVFSAHGWCMVSLTLSPSVD